MTNLEKVYEQFGHLDLLVLKDKNMIEFDDDIRINVSQVIPNQLNIG